MEVPALQTPESNIEKERPKEVSNTVHQSSNNTLASTVLECDYDTPSSISRLYKAIENKDWSAVINTAESNPEQAATWVSRKESSGKLRWRLLPLHAAIIFKSPEKVIEHLLSSYPLGAQCKDDQGMLPIHLAFRNGSSEGVVNLLLVAYPQSIHVKDRKGRIPLVLAQASSSPNKESFLRALERGPSYYAVAAAATERAAVTAEQKAIFDAKVQQVEQESQGKVLIVQNEIEVRSKTYEDRISTLEQELESSKNMSHVLSDHISALEAQLESRGDAELLLANKCKKLEELAKNVQKERDTLDVELNVERRFNKELEEKSMSLEQEQVNMKKDIEVKDNTYHSLETTQHTKNQSLLKSNEQLKGQLANAHTTIVAMDARLKKRTAVEVSLTKQLSDMARQTAEMSASKDVAESEQETSKLTYDNELLVLNHKIEDLKQQLLEASEGLSSMVQDQEQVCLLAQNYEEKMAMSHNQHEGIQNSIHAQKQHHDLIRTQRESIISLLQTQMEELDVLDSNHISMTTALETQGKDLESVEYLRNMMLDCALKQKQDLCDRIVDINEGLKQVGDKEEDLSTQDVAEKISMASAEEEEDIRDETPFENDAIECYGGDEERTEKKEEISSGMASEELVDAGIVKKIVTSIESNTDDNKIELNTPKSEIVAE